MAAASAQATDPDTPTATAGELPYGPLATEPDDNGLLLPDGFTSRVIAVAGEEVADTGYAWHLFPDGAATFEAPDGGWYYACNSEVALTMAPANGGVSAVHFDEDGKIVDAYRILEGSDSNCAGGPTPWGTWLSCEESADQLGRVWECDPSGKKEAVAYTAMGQFSHEAVAVDPEGEQLYLTEDFPAGLLYRFTPADYPKLDAGKLEAAKVADDGSVTWVEVADPTAADTPTREQAEGASTFNGGEGIWFHDGVVTFTTKGDNCVRALHIADQRIELLWRGDTQGPTPGTGTLTGVDNITADAATGDLYVAEDGGNMEVVMITADGVVAPFLRVVGEGHGASEITGPCFNPDRTRLYFSSQRGPSDKLVSDIDPDVKINGQIGGVTFEVTGPFRGAKKPAVGEVSPSTTLAKAAPGSSSDTDDDDGDDSDDDTPVVPIVLGAVAAAAVVGGAVIALRRRGTRSPADGSTADAEPADAPGPEPEGTDQP